MIMMKVQKHIDIKFISLARSYINNWQLVLMFLPTILCLGIFHYVPIYGLVIAFKDFTIAKGIMHSDWVGLLQFKKLFMAPSFVEVFKNSIWISFLRIVFGFPGPIILALLLNEIRTAWYKKAVQTISYLPHFLSWIVLSGMFMNVLSPSGGMVNQLIVLLGGKPIYFMADPDYFVSMLITTGIWKGVGWGTIVYLASIASINPELYEAATVDGANRFSRVIHITIPSIIPVICIMFILQSGNLINAGFDQIYNMYNPAVYKVADIIDTYVYRRGLIEMKYSFSAAAGLFKNLISFGLVLTTNIIVKKVNGEQGGIW